MLDVHLEVVLQVLADARDIGDHVDAEPPQLLGIADPGQLEELRRCDRPAREDHLAGPGLDSRAAVRVFDADRAVPLEQDPGDERAGLDAKVRCAP